MATSSADLRKGPASTRYSRSWREKRPAGQIDVAHLDGLGQGGQVQVMPRQAGRVGHDAHLALAPGHHIGAAGVGDALEAVEEFVGDAAELVVVGGVAVEGQGDDGHVVDAHGLDHPAGHAGGHLVDIGEDLVIDLEEAGLEIFPNLELGGDDGEAVPGLGIEVFQALHLPEFFLEIDDHQVFHFRGVRPRGSGSGRPPWGP